MERKAVKFITVFILSLVLVVTCPLLGFQSEAATIAKPQETMNVGSTYLSPGVDNCVTVSFPGYVTGLSVGSYQFAFYCAPYYVPSEQQEDVWYYIDNVRIVMLGVEYPASYQSSANYLMQGTFDFTGADPHYSILIDLHRVSSKSGSGHMNFGGEARSHGNLSSGTWTGTVPAFNYYGTISDDPLNSYKHSITVNSPQHSMNGYFSANTSNSTYFTDVWSSFESRALLATSGTMYLQLGQHNVVPTATITQQVTDSTQQKLTQQQTNAIKDQTNQQHKDSQDQLKESQKQTNAIKDQTNQQHKDSQDQLQESQKQTDAMTKFDGKSDMDKNSSDLNGSLSGYDEAQQSIFSSSTTSIEKFDIDNLFNFTANISAALLVWNNLMVSIVASMGDFSLIYTISMGLVFIGIVVGIWRYFVK